MLKTKGLKKKYAKVSRRKKTSIVFFFSQKNNTNTDSFNLNKMRTTRKITEWCPLNMERIITNPEFYTQHTYLPKVKEKWKHFQTKK